MTNKIKGNCLFGPFVRPVNLIFFFTRFHCKADVCWVQQRVCINWEQRRPVINGVSLEKLGDRTERSILEFKNYLTVNHG